MPIEQDRRPRAADTAAAGKQRGMQPPGDRLARAYAERNVLAVAFVKMALAAGWEAGQAVDEDPRKGWSPDWRHMLCVRLPTGELLQWHVSPQALPLLSDIPPYKGPLDGPALARDGDWPLRLVCIGKLAVPKSPSTAAAGRERVKASFFGARTFRVEECGSFHAALGWLIRNRHQVVRDAKIEEPGKPAHCYTPASLNELAVRIEGRQGS